MSGSRAPNPLATTSSSTSGTSAAPTVPKLQAVPAFEPKYLPTPGNPSMAWETWSRLYGYFLIGSGLSAASEQSRLASLYQSLGTEGARICAGLCPDGTAFDQVLVKLTARFGERKSYIYSRSQFHSRNQHSGEDIQSYVTELRTLITLCHYNAAFEDEVLRDRFVAGVRNEKIRERLFMEDNAVTIDRCIELAETVERATSEASKVKDYKHSNEKSEPVGAVNTHKSSYRRDFHQPRSKTPDPRQRSHRSPSQSNHHSNRNNSAQRSDSSSEKCADACG